MIKRKSPREIKLMREAGRIVAKAHHAVSDAVKPGVTTADIDAIVKDVVTSMGAEPSFKGYGGFPGNACTSINDEIVHGIPSKQRKLIAGDILKVDIGAYYKGFHGDSAWTYPVDEIAPGTKELLEATEASLMEGLRQIRKGARLSDISHAVQTVAEDRGFSVVRDFVGHGIGRNLHEDPQIPNYGPPGRGPVLKPGMTFAIEPMVNAGGPEIRVLDDGWTAVTSDNSLSAHYEHTIVVTEDGFELLTVL